MVAIDIQQLDPELPLPTRGRASDIGYDLVSAVDIIIEPGEQANIPTGVAISLPPEVAGLVLPRSGLARDWGFSMVNAPGLIDPGYIGEISLLGIVLGKKPLHITRGMRCAQLVLTPTLSAEWVVVDTLKATERGDSGFGSSGH